MTKQERTENKENIGVKNDLPRGQKEKPVLKEKFVLQNRNGNDGKISETKVLGEVKNLQSTRILKSNTPIKSKESASKSGKCAVLKPRNDNVPWVSRSTPEVIMTAKKSNAKSITISEQVSDLSATIATLSIAKKIPVETVTVPAKAEWVHPDRVPIIEKRREASKEQERKEYLESVRNGKYSDGSPAQSIPVSRISAEPRIIINSPQRFEERRYNEIMPDIHGLNPVFSGPPQLSAVLDNSGREEQYWPRDEFRVTENNVSLAGSPFSPRFSTHDIFSTGLFSPPQVNLFPFPPPIHQQYVEPTDQEGVPAFVDIDGYITLHLNHKIVVDVSANKAIRIRDGKNHTALAVSACGLQMAMVHPKGRVLQYGSRIEVQCMDDISVKNAKMYPKGISFTANNCALVYLVDVAGARTTSDMFHDLYENNVAETLFRESCKQNPEDSVDICSLELSKAQYWRNDKNEDCWIFGQIHIKQKSDGLTVVERRNDREFILLKSSPSTGKVRLGNKFASVTASLGDQSHIFIKAQERRMHYNGQNSVFTVRNAGHAAGFDETGLLRLF